MSRHTHGNGPIHLAHESGGQVFDIYPLAQDGMESTAARIGFAVPSVDEAFTALLAAGGRPVSITQRFSVGETGDHLRS